MDEDPQAHKQSPWPEHPGQPFFRVEVARRDSERWCADVAPVRWGSHRRTFYCYRWPGREEIGIDWADVAIATVLDSGEVLNRAQLWRAVLRHRDDEPLPWYVTYADERPLASAIIRARQDASGRFQAKDLLRMNEALESVGLNVIPKEALAAVKRGSIFFDEGHVDMSTVDAIARLTSHERAALDRFMGGCR